MSCLSHHLEWCNAYTEESIRCNKLWGHIYIVTLFFNQLMHFIFYLFSEGVLFLLCYQLLFFLLCYIKYLIFFTGFCLGFGSGRIRIWFSLVLLFTILTAIYFIKVFCTMPFGTLKIQNLVEMLIGMQIWGARKI